jgi:hypothetical protein
VENIENHPSRISDKTCVGLLWQNRSTWGKYEAEKAWFKENRLHSAYYAYVEPDKIRYLILAFGSLPRKMSSTIAPISLFMALVVARGPRARLRPAVVVALGTGMRSLAHEIQVRPSA